MTEVKGSSWCIIVKVKRGSFALIGRSVDGATVAYLTTHDDQCRHTLVTSFDPWTVTTCKGKSNKYIRLAGPVSL